MSGIEQKTTRERIPDTQGCLGVEDLKLLSLSVLVMVANSAWIMLGGDDDGNEFQEDGDANCDGVLTSEQLCLVDWNILNKIRPAVFISSPAVSLAVTLGDACDYYRWLFWAWLLAIISLHCSECFGVDSLIQLSRFPGTRVHGLNGFWVVYGMAFEFWPVWSIQNFFQIFLTRKIKISEKKIEKNKGKSRVKKKKKQGERIMQSYFEIPISTSHLNNPHQFFGLVLLGFMLQKDLHWALI